MNISKKSNFFYDYFFSKGKQKEMHILYDKANKFEYIGLFNFFLFIH